MMMRAKSLSFSFGLFLVVALLQGTVAAAEETKADSLAQRYSVEPQVVQGLRDKDRGWGEISNELALAQQLSKDQPDTYPTTNDALRRIETMRQEGKGWGAISKEMGYRHGSIVSDSRRSEKAEKPDRPEKPNKPEKPEKADHHTNR